MAISKIVLDRQAIATDFEFGTTSASGEGLVTINNGTAASSNLVLDVKGTADIDGNLGVGGDLNLTGDLNITGTVNAQSVTNLEVSDLTITMNSGGTTPSDNTAGIIVEGTSATTIGAIYWNDASATKFTIGTGSSQQDIVGLSATQTLTNKTLTTPTIGNFSNATHNHTNAANGGQLTDAALSSAVTVPKGGTGRTSNTAYAIMVGGTTSTGAQQQVSGVGTSGQVLTSNGAGVLPSWQDATGGGGSFALVTVTGTQDSSNKTFTLGSTISSADQIFLNGQLLTPGSTNDYEISGTTLTFTASFTAPASTDVIRAYGNV